MSPSSRAAMTCCATWCSPGTWCRWPNAPDRARTRPRGSSPQNRAAAPSCLAGGFAGEAGLSVPRPRLGPVTEVLDDTARTDTARLLLIDGHSIAYRAFYALPLENFSTTTGQPTNAVF